MFFLIDIIDDPKFFRPQGILFGEFPLQGLAQERGLLQFFDVIFLQGFDQGMKGFDLLTGSFGIE